MILLKLTLILTVSYEQGLEVGTFIFGHIIEKSEFVVVTFMGEFYCRVD